MDEFSTAGSKSYRLKCSEVELAALRESTLLLRFAAEHVADLDESLSLAIAEARAAAENDSWAPEIAQKFWNSFGRLCTVVKPTTMDALEAGNHRYLNPGVSGWMLGKRRQVSLSERSSSRYIVSLLGFIIVIVFLQLYMWACTTLSKRMDDLSTSSKSQFLSISNAFFALSASTSPENHVWTAEEGRVGNRISSDSFDLNSDIGASCKTIHELS